MAVSRQHVPLSPPKGIRRLRSAVLPSRAAALLIIAVVACGLVPAAPTARAAAAAARITNIGVAVTGGNATYAICVEVPWPPAAGAVTIRGPQGQRQAPLQYGSGTCGAGLYRMDAAFMSLPAGLYRFQAACVLLGPGPDGNQGPAVPCLVRDVGFVSNFQGSTVGRDCQVDFDASRDLPLRSCAAAGAAGNLQGAAVTAAASPTAPRTPVTPVGTVPQVAWAAPASGHAFFAEGYTGTGYREYLSLLNPGARGIDVQVTLQRADGASRGVRLRLAPLARTSLDVNALAPRASTAIRVEAAQGMVVAERALYVTGGSGHIVAGATLPADRWYVAEGYVGGGFADGLRVFNPYDLKADLTITAFDGQGVARTTRLAVQGGTRRNLALNDLALHGAAALMIASSSPVVVESILSRADAGPSAAMALTDPARTWYFPDGGTAAGSEEYLALFNPNTVDTTVRLQPVTMDEPAPWVVIRVAPHARAVLPLQQLLQRASVAAVLYADHPIVAQETRYTAHSASLVDGVARPGRSWALAEGYTGAGFSEWIALLNPGDKPAHATIRLIGRRGPNVLINRMLQPHRLDRVYINGLLPHGAVSALVRADRPVVVGRTLTFDGSSGLSTTSGVALDTGGA